MLTRADLGATALALAAHALVGYALLRAPSTPSRQPSPIEVEFRAPAAAPGPPSPAAPPAPRSRTPAPRAPSRRVASAPPARTAPPPPVFGVTMESVVAGDASTSVPVGNTTAIAPGAAPPAGAARASGAPEGEGGLLSIAALPDVDADACGRAVAYPKEAESAGIEGTVKLRVALDERGRVVDVKVLSGLGHGLDEAAVEALAHRCRFTPAIASDGRAVPFVIDPYLFHFEIPR